MNPISFKDLRLFRSKDTPSQKSKKTATKMEEKKERKPWQKLVQNPFLYLVVFVITLSSLISYVPSRSLPVPEQGEIASSDIIAPADLTIIDKETTEKRREEAVEAVPPVYAFNANVFPNTEEKIREFFNAGRNLLNNQVTTQSKADFQTQVFESYGLEITSKDLNALIKNKFATTVEENLINLIMKVSRNFIITSKTLFLRGEEQKGLTIRTSEGTESSQNVSDTLDIKEAKENLDSEVEKLDLPQSEKALLRSLSHLFVSQNIFYDQVETQAKQEQARASVEDIFYTIKKGKVIVRKGDEVSEDVLKQIGIINQNLRAKPSWWVNFIGTFLLFGLLFVTLWYYLKSFLGVKEAFSSYLMMGILLVLSLLFYKLSIFLADTFSQSSNLFLLSSAESYRYAFPFQFGVLLFAFLISSPVALIYAVINSLLVGYLFKTNIELMIFCLIGGFAAIYGIKYYGRQDRTSTFRTGLLLIAPINIFVIITFHLIKEKLIPLSLFSSDLLMAFLGGLLSAAVAFLFLPVFEFFFGFVTQARLHELTNSDLPVFRQMAIEAPGSYHHSLIVASLAEKAAEEIKLDSLLVKAGALYHDIGKTKRPEYFLENRPRNPDMHKDLKPAMSALVILNHVKEGVELAKKLKLPRKIRDIIETHHGKSLVRYFFEKAKDTYDPEMQEIGEESYRYPGPLPKKKEAALVMLSDAVEAASRSLKAPSKPNLKRVISEIFNNALQDGQLDDCDISIKELRVTADSFLETLYTIYHPRVEYPGFEFEIKKKKKTNKKPANDRNHKPTKKAQNKQEQI
ncbi:MAG: HDIG domain-containing protein [Candidatus Aminicenantes bacterium]|nr:HDIG domain-containing protein [Candidatus Aminicenantes bacterium]